MDITLIVKASNQQFEDQTIKCEPSWSIRRLKGHLTEVHPGKPSTEEQKLIYSGQLLGDSVILKDVLRQYDGQQAYTVHLVFTPKNNRYHKDPGGSSNNNSASKTATPNVKSESANAQTSSSVTSSSSDSPRTMATTPGTSDIQSDGLRQRNVTSGQSNSAATNDRASPFTTSSTVTADHIMGQHLAMQNWMQQTYMQYLNQYMNALSNAQAGQQISTGSHTFPVPTIPQPNLLQMPRMPVTAANANPVLAQPSSNFAYYPYLSNLSSSQMPLASSIPAPITSSGSILNNPLQPSNVPAVASSSSSAPAPAVLPKGSGSSTLPSTEATAGPSTTVGASAASSVQAGRATHNGAANAAAVDRDNAENAAAEAAADPAAAPAPAPARRFPNIVVEEQENRDWLDIFFSVCRVIILMTVVYMYSSPMRCLTVFIVGASLYLYQVGFFRNNNAERLERARRIVVQQLNNAHGIRPGGAAHARMAEAAAAPEVDRNGAAGDANTETSTSAESTKDATSRPTETSEKDVNNTNTENSSPTVNTSTTSEEEESLSATEPSSAGSIEVDDLTSNVVPEANRVNLNDVAAFLRTLVLSFFTSIIPDTPAA